MIYAKVESCLCGLQFGWGERKKKYDHERLCHKRAAELKILKQESKASVPQFTSKDLVVLDEDDVLEHTLTVAAYTTTATTATTTATATTSATTTTTSRLKKVTKRKSYAHSFKLRVISLLHILKGKDEKSRRASGVYIDVANTFGLDESLVSRWVKNESSIREAFIFSKGKRGRGNRGQLLFRKPRGICARFAKEEQLLFEMMRELRKKGKKVTCGLIKLKMVQLVRNKTFMTENNERWYENFKGSTTWLYRFSNRHNLVVRRKTNTKAKNIEEILPKLRKFHARLRHRVRPKKKNNNDNNNNNNDDNNDNNNNDDNNDDKQIQNTLMRIETTLDEFDSLANQINSDEFDSLANQINRNDNNEMIMENENENENRFMYNHVYDGPSYGRFPWENRFNVDQVPCPLENGIDSTYEERGKTHVRIQSCGSNATKRFCTLQIMMRLSNDNNKFPQPRMAIIFKGTGARIKSEESEGWDKRVDVYFQKKAWADTKFTLDWINNTLTKTLEQKNQSGEVILFMDNLAAQTQPATRAALKRLNVKFHYLVANATDNIQPVDHNVGVTVKRYMSVIMLQMFEDDEELGDYWYGVSDKGSMPLWQRRVLLTKWAGEAWERVCSKMDFRNIGFSTGCNMTVDGKMPGTDEKMKIKINGVEDYGFDSDDMDGIPEDSDDLDESDEDDQSGFDTDKDGNDSQDEYDSDVASEDANKANDDNSQYETVQIGTLDDLNNDFEILEDSDDDFDDTAETVDIGTVFDFDYIDVEKVYVEDVKNVAVNAEIIGEKVAIAFSMNDSNSIGWMVGTIKSECTKKEFKEHGYNFNIYFHEEKFVMPSTLCLETYGYDEEWVILKKVTCVNDVDNICQEPFKEGDKVKCSFKDIDGGSVFHNGIVKRLFKHQGSWKYIVVFADETVPVDHEDMEINTEDILLHEDPRIKKFMKTQNHLLLQSVN